MFSSVLIFFKKQNNSCANSTDIHSYIVIVLEGFATRMNGEVKVHLPNPFYRKNNVSSKTLYLAFLKKVVILYTNQIAM